MEYFVYLNGQQQGPLTKEQLQELHITPDTPVWYEGLPDWQPASQAEGTAWLFNQQPQVPPYQPQAQQTQQTQVPPYQPQVPPYQQQTPPYQAQEQRYQQPYAQEEPKPMCPDNYLGWAIAATLLCCLPFGIVAIIKATSVNEKYARGDYQGAEEASRSAKTWCWVAAGLGFAFAAIYTILYIFVLALV